jgi:hypothetical protein
MLLSLARTCPCSAVASFARVGQRVSRSATAGRVTRGLRTPSTAGRVWVTMPRSRLEVALIWVVRSSSKPASTPSLAIWVSFTRMLRKVCGTVRTASAKIAASRAAVFAVPGCRSAIRRMASPGRCATCTPSLPSATATDSAPIVAGWSTTISTGPCAATSSSRIARSRAPSLDKALS